MGFKKFRFTKDVCKFKKGQIVDDSDLRIRRLIKEGDCLEDYKEEKQVKPETIQNKMEKIKPENKEVK